MAGDLARIGRALISVSDKSGLVELGAALAARGIEIVSTGGTARALGQAGLAVRDAAELTGFPEMMDGRLKTLHPGVHGGLLAIREIPRTKRRCSRTTSRRSTCWWSISIRSRRRCCAARAFEDIVENIDIGGPAMIRGAAKNHGDVAVVVEPGDYRGADRGTGRHDGATSLKFRRALAQKAFARTAAYDAAISNWLAREIGERAPAWRAFGGRLVQSMRYGENPHQSAAFYAGPEPRPGVATARQVQGKELSFNNVNDTDAAFELVAEFDPARSAAVAIIKHANPCGVAEAPTLREAYEKALACDPVSAFGGMVALNRPLDADAARKIVEIFTEVIIAPGADEEALAIVAARRNLRLLIADGVARPARAECVVSLRRRRLSGAGSRQRGRRRHCAAGGDQTGAERARTRRYAVRLARRQARQIQRHRLRQGRRDGRHRRGADVARRFLARRGPQGRGRRAGGGRRGAADPRLGRRLRRVFPVRRRPGRGGAGRRRSR